MNIKLKTPTTPNESRIIIDLSIEEFTQLRMASDWYIRTNEKYISSGTISYKKNSIL